MRDWRYQIKRNGGLDNHVLEELLTKSHLKVQPINHGEKEHAYVAIDNLHANGGSGNGSYWQI